MKEKEERKGNERILWGKVGGGINGDGGKSQS